jgi:hypothetical protein
LFLVRWQEDCMTIYDELFLAGAIRAKPTPISAKVKAERDQTEQVPVNESKHRSTRKPEN